MKVCSLLKQVAKYSGEIPLNIVPFTHIQEEIKDKCPEELFTIIMRRFMMRCSEKIAKKNGCGALITGESVGQVASQTMQAIGCTEAVVEDLPVFRPLIGMDKDEVIERARYIGTFETSILPYEDCCTIFVAKHPVTKPNIQMIKKSEKKLEERLTDYSHLTKQGLITLKYLAGLLLMSDRIWDFPKIEQKQKILKLLCSEILLDGKNIVISIRKPISALAEIGSCQIWQGRQDSNPRHSVLETDALPAELHPYIFLPSFIHNR